MRLLKDLAEGEQDANEAFKRPNDLPKLLVEGITVSRTEEGCLSRPLVDHGPVIRHKSFSSGKVFSCLSPADVTEHHPVRRAGLCWSNLLSLSPDVAIFVPTYGSRYFGHVQHVGDGFSGG
jgi:hypothetical protein